MTLQRKAAFAAIILSAIFSIGCGDTFRPIETPILTPGPDPSALKHATVLFTAGPSTPGAVIHIDISGDSNVGQVSVGHDPVSMGFYAGALKLFVANQGDSTVSSYTTFQPTLGVPTTTSLPAGSAPDFVFSPIGSAVYVALSGTNELGFIDPTLNALTKTIPVGTDPVAISGISDGTKIYVVNKGSNNVSVVNARDFTVTATIPVGTSPGAIVASGDSARMYVMNTASNNVSVIDTATDTVSTTIPVGAGPSSGVFDPKLLRLYVANSADTRISIINADPTDAAFNTQTFVTVGNGPISIAPLSNGLKVYVANAGSRTISVIDVLNSTVVKTIPLDSSTAQLQPVSLGAAPDASKVIVAVMDLSGLNVESGAVDIATATDTIVATIPAPVTPCPAGTAGVCRMQPVQVAITP